MENKLETPTTVEELQDFPFKSFQEFIRAWKEGTALLNIDTTVAHNTAFWTGGFSKMFSVSTVISICEWSLILVPVGSFVYIIASRMWLMFLSLPLFIIAPFAFNQDTPKTIRRGLFWLTALGLCISIEISRVDITILAVALLIIWLAQKVIHDVSLYVLTNAATKDESLLCKLWNDNSMSISFRNGDEYCVYWKTEKGKKIYYKEAYAYSDKRFNKIRHAYLP